MLTRADLKIGQEYITKTYGRVTLLYHTDRNVFLTTITSAEFIHSLDWFLSDSSLPKKTRKLYVQLRQNVHGNIYSISSLTPLSTTNYSDKVLADFILDWEEGQEL